MTVKLPYSAASAAVYVFGSGGGSAGGGGDGTGAGSVLPGCGCVPPVISVLSSPGDGAGVILSCAVHANCVIMITPNNMKDMIFLAISNLSFLYILFLVLIIYQYLVISIDFTFFML